MAIAYSQSPIVYTTGLRQDTSPHLRADLDTALLSAGWVHTTNTVSNGFEYQCTSPQGLAARCQIYDTNTGGTGNQLTFKFLGTAGTNTGWQHTLLCSQTGTSYNNGYQIVAGVCQFFVSLPGVSYLNPVGAGHFANAVAGGIPFLPNSTNTECTAETGGPLPTELWWSCGATGNHTDFRTQNYCIAEFSYSKNNTAYLGTTSGSFGDDKYALRLFPLVQTNANAPVTVLMVPVFYDTGSPGTPIFIDSLMGWGNQIQGQLWDSFMMTESKLLEDVQTFSETFGTSTWINYSNAPTGWQANGNGTLLFALYLMTGFQQGPGNYAY